MNSRMQAIYEEAIAAEEPRAYIKPGTHRLQLKSYTFLDGSGFKQAYGPAFTFTVISSDNPEVTKGSNVNKMINMNCTFQPDKTKRSKMVGIRRKELRDLCKALLVSKQEIEEESDLDFELIFKKLHDQEEVSKELAGVQITCVATASAAKDKDGNPYINCVYTA